MLNWYKSTKFGNMHDYYIAEYSLNSNEMVMLGSSPDSEHARLDNFSLSVDVMVVVQT